MDNFEALVDYMFRLSKIYHRQGRLRDSMRIRKCLDAAFEVEYRLDTMYRKFYYCCRKYDHVDTGPHECEQLNKGGYW